MLMRQERTSRPKRLLAHVVAGVLALAALVVPAAHVNAAVPLRILTVGDSITHGGTAGTAYRTELSRLLSAAGVAHELRVAAWPGQNCAYMAGQLGAQLSMHSPGLVLLSCGTNDWPGQTEAPYRAMLSALTAANIKTVASWVQYSDPRTAPQASWLLPNEKAANDAIFRARYVAPAFTNVPIADFQAIPGTLEFLDSLGIHPNIRGYRAMAHIFYAAAAPLMGWPSLAALGEPALCGLSGNWREYAEPRPGTDYLECTS